MSLVIPDGFCNVHFLVRTDGDNETMSFALGFDHSVAPGDRGTTTDLISDATTASNLGAIWDAEWDFLGVEVEWGTATTPLRLESNSGAFAGSGTAQGLPNNCALLVRKVTDTPGRAGRGRMYIPGVNEENVNSAGVLVGGFQATAQALVNDWQADLLAVVGLNSLVLFHTEGGPISTPSDIFSLAVQPQIATQRRRMRR